MFLTSDFWMSTFSTTTHLISSHFLLLTWHFLKEKIRLCNFTLVYKKLGTLDMPIPRNNPIPDNSQSTKYMSRSCVNTLGKWKRSWNSTNYKILLKPIIMLNRMQIDPIRRIQFKHPNIFNNSTSLFFFLVKKNFFSLRLYSDIS